MKLSTLLEDWATVMAEQDVEVTALTLDSREATAGSAFLAVKGEYVDGRDFIVQAIDNGAAAVIYEQAANDEPEIDLTKTDTAIPLLGVTDLKVRVSALAARFYGEPGHELLMIGITGTNGKSSVAYFLAQALTLLGTDAAMIGTIGVGRPNALRPSALTTPDAISVQAQLRELLDQGVQAVCMEVSSHGLDQGRVAAVPFQIAIFTNLSQDHLDYHGDMERYAAAKRKLFEMDSVQQAVINMDDATGKVWRSTLGCSIHGYGQAGAAMLRIHAVATQANGLQFELSDDAESVRVNSAVLGVFNAWNLAAVAACLQGMGYALHDLLPVLEQCRAPAGRMQTIALKSFGSSACYPKVVVDYAHTPDALEKALQTLRSHCQGDLSVVFGCGGDRDTDKRPKMGAIAERWADAVVLTDDNPRSENPAAIIEDVRSGMRKAPKVEHDRQQAICGAISDAGETDWVLIAGKGHETTQLIGAEVVEFNDAKVAMACLQQTREAA